MKSWFRDPLSRKLFKGIYGCDFWVSLKLTSNRKPGSSIFCSKTNPFRLIFTYCDHVFVANIFPSTKFWATKIMTHWRVFLHQIPFFHKQDVGPIIRTCHCVKQAYYIHCQWACTALSGNCLKHLKILKSLFLMFVPHLLYFFILFFVHVHVGPMDRATCVMASTPPPPPTVLEILDSPLLSFFNTQCSSQFHTLSSHIDSQQCDWRQLFKVYSEL